ncbi:hypothetical protein V7195_02090 [Priestia megaterium]|uniref:hypothetical protein n=1 Tax=Priestia megaterium TaxID=1404 RepID=UPI000BF48D67|nr:hypothetical protein [Priestia megaterium]PFK02129.1 hypothetical protein COI96_06985 [Priestia megaterium]PMD08004.1 hypothetical protein CJ194_18550 [Priestia megaterium]TJZ40357.1 hypothetical protein FA002_01955 [Priestia megaterium]
MNNKEYLVMSTEEYLADPFILPNELLFEYAAGNRSVLEREFDRRLVKKNLLSIGELHRVMSKELDLHRMVSFGIQDLLVDAGYTKEYKEEDFINLVLPAILSILGESNRYTEEFYRYIFNIGVEWKENKIYTTEEKRLLHNY